MDNYPPNSKKSGEPPPPKEAVQKIVTGKIIKKKTPLGQRFKVIFFGGESKGALQYVVSDVLIPALRNMFVDAVEGGARRMIYGDSTPRRAREQYGNSRISYNSPTSRYSHQSAILPKQPPLSSSGRRQDIGQIIISSRGEAEEVLERLTDIIDKYDVASVCDLHDLVGLQSSYVDNDWGWSSLSTADVRQVREGWILNLPPVEPIK